MRAMPSPASRRREPLGLGDAARGQGDVGDLHDTRGIAVSLAVTDEKDHAPAPLPCQPRNRATASANSSGASQGSMCPALAMRSTRAPGMSWPQRSA